MCGNGAFSASAGAQDFMLSPLVSGNASACDMSRVSAGAVTFVYALLLRQSLAPLQSNNRGAAMKLS